jgi:Ser/Thr protein kinase RdoA (MazF antagonist)
MMRSVLKAFGLNEESKMESFGTGLINKTWKITTPDSEYILQKVNHKVFEKPASIAKNIRLISAYLKQHYPDYCFVSPIVSSEGDMIYIKEEGYFRLFPFIKGSHSKDVAETPEQANEAAAQFGRFTRLLSGFDANQLEVTIPQFHDLGLRYQQFLKALDNGNKQRITEAKQLIDYLLSLSDIADDHNNLITNPDLKVRVTHHDTKISNVLFNSEEKGICVIDLDTVMPGYFISDVGDMMRTYLSPVSEEEKDTSKIIIREEYYKAIVKGYYNEMKDELTELEKNLFFYAGKFMIYMQALRFLTDHVNDDIYYGAKYTGQNLVRGTNQVVLLQRLIEKENRLILIEKHA